MQPEDACSKLPIQAGVVSLSVSSNFRELCRLVRLPLTMQDTVSSQHVPLDEFI